jgi:cytochrome c-type biogenesis protein CcmH/NrfF
MNIRNAFAVVAFSLISVGAFAAELPSTPVARDGMAASTTAAPATAPAKKLHCPKCQHVVKGKCAPKG